MPNKIINNRFAYILLFAVFNYNVFFFIFFPLLFVLLFGMRSSEMCRLWWKRVEYCALQPSRKNGKSNEKAALAETNSKASSLEIAGGGDGSGRGICVRAFTLKWLHWNAQNMRASEMPVNMRPTKEEFPLLSPSLSFFRMQSRNSGEQMNPRVICISNNKLALFHPLLGVCVSIYTLKTCK